MFKVSVNFTVKMVIERTLKKEGDDCKGWAASEAVERGDGQWDKVRTSHLPTSNQSSNLILRFRARLSSTTAARPMGL